MERAVVEVLVDPTGEDLLGDYPMIRVSNDRHKHC